MTIIITNTFAEIETMKATTNKILSVCAALGTPIPTDEVDKAFKKILEGEDQRFACPHITTTLTKNAADKTVTMTIDMSEEAFKAYLSLIDEVTDTIVNPVAMTVIGMIKMLKGSFKALMNKAAKIGEMFIIPSDQKKYALKRHTYKIDGKTIHAISIWESDGYNAPSPVFWWKDSEKELGGYIDSRIRKESPVDSEYVYDSYDDAYKAHDELYRLLTGRVDATAINIDDLEEQCDGADKKKPTLDGFIKQNFDDFNKK